MVSFYQEDYKESDKNKFDVKKWAHKAPFGNKTLWINTQINTQINTHNPPGLSYLYLLGPFSQFLGGCAV